MLNGLIYLSISIAATVGLFAVALGWEPPGKLVAMAAFMALGFACNARGTQAEQRCVAAGEKTA